jgi:uncharacterized protein (TIGR02147 family)
MKVHSIFKFLDYREYLQHFFETSKSENPWYSYKVFGDVVGLDQSQVYRILQKQLHLSKKALPRFVQYLKLEGIQAEYFIKLVALGRSRKTAETRTLFAEVLALRGTKTKTLEKYQFQMYSEWHHTVIRALLGTIRIKDDYESLGQMLTPPISEGQARKSVELLKRLGLTIQDHDGFWKLTDPSLTTGTDYSSLMVREYQAESMKLAIQSLNLHARELRDINVVNMAVDEYAFQDCLGILRSAREQIRERIEKVNSPDRVMRLATAFFPVALVKKGDKK